MLFPSSAVRGEPGVDVQTAPGQAALLGPVRLHEVKLVAASVWRMAVGTGNKPLAVGRPVLDRVGSGDGQPGWVVAVGVDPPAERLVHVGYSSFDRSRSRGPPSPC